MLFTKFSPPSGFYIYLYLREDGTPYYVGKGKDKRAWQKGKREAIKPPIDSTRITIVEDNMEEALAFALEVELIKQYGRKDLGTGILWNKTNGGDGSSGYMFTKADRAKQKAGRAATEEIRLKSLKKYHDTVDKNSKEYIERIERIRNYQKNKIWTEKAIANRTANCLKAAAARKGSTWKPEHRKLRMNTYVMKNLEIANKIFELADSGFNKLTISKMLNISWEKVHYPMIHRAEFEAYKETQNYQET